MSLRLSEPLYLMDSWDPENFGHDLLQDGCPAVDARRVADLVLVNFDDAISQARCATVDIDGEGHLLTGIGLVFTYIEAACLERVH